MMKNLLAWLMCSALFLTAHSQNSRYQFSLNAQGSIASGQTRPAIGGFAEGLYRVRKAGYISLTGGVFIFHSPPKFADKTVTQLIPVQVGFKQNFSNFFLQPQIGLGPLNGKINTNNDLSRPSVLALFYGLNTGINLKRFRIGLNLQQVQGVGSTNDGVWYNAKIKYGGVYIGYQIL